MAKRENESNLIIPSSREGIEHTHIALTVKNVTLRYNGFFSFSTILIITMYFYMVLKLVAALVVQCTFGVIAVHL